MLQLAVYRNPRPGSRKHAPFLLDVQSDLVTAGLRVVVPLVEPDYFGPPMKRLNPVLRVLGHDYILAPLEIGSLPTENLRDPVASLSGNRSEIMDALDFLLHGF
jgi:toxin CcdB